MPAKINEILDKFQVEQDEIVERRNDPVTDFKILSELNEQASMQYSALAGIGDKDSEVVNRMKNLQILRKAIQHRMYNLLDIDRSLSKEDRLKQFNERYNKISSNLREDDLVYNNIIDETRRRLAKLRGGKTLKVAK